MKWTIAAVLILLAAAAASIAMLVSRDAEPVLTSSAPAIDASERSRAIEALKSRTTRRPVIAILANNDGTEIADLLSTFGVLRQADVAQLIVVAEKRAPIRAYPGDLRVMAQTSMSQFDRDYPAGADYVVVPAMDPHDNPVVIDWLLAQRKSGAKIVSVCNGSLTLGAAGLLDGRRATSHWSTVNELRSRHPTMHWVEDRRYVTDGDVTTATGITASLPLMLALVEAIGGRQAAQNAARELGVEHWDARHDSGAFRLDAAHRWTFVRNKARFWARQERDVVVDGADEIALAMTIDAYSRTELVSVVSVASAKQIRSKRGLALIAGRVGGASTLPPPLSLLPNEAAKTPQIVLERIESEFDPLTARYVALTLEYPWRAQRP